MAPIKPFWKQPSHPDIQEVQIFNEEEFSSRSLSRVSVPPFGLFAKMSFPPCTAAAEPTYATVQMSRDAHLNLNSDLLYINHSCEPSLIFDMTRLEILAGPAGLKPGDELTFFYPSTEWSMAQGFDCLCGTPSCRGRISGASTMSSKQLEGTWLNAHIRDLLDEQAASKTNGAVNGETAQKKSASVVQNGESKNGSMAEISQNGWTAHGEGGGDASKIDGSKRHGPGSRALSGEMGGDTQVAEVAA